MASEKAGDAFDHGRQIEQDSSHRGMLGQHGCQYLTSTNLYQRPYTGEVVSLHHCCADQCGKAIHRVGEDLSLLGMLTSIVVVLHSVHVFKRRNVRANAVLKLHPATYRPRPINDTRYAPHGIWNVAAERIGHRS